MSTIKDSPSILVVDDNSFNLDIVYRILIKANFQVITAIDGIEAINQVKSNSPQLILLDIMMPKLDGFETCRLLKQNPETCDIPIILMSSLAETEKKVKAFNLGADDYITKPFQKAELLARVKSQLQLFDSCQTLAMKNYLLQNKINQKYKTEVSLLDINASLTDTNQLLKTELENCQAAKLKLQSEVLAYKAKEIKAKKSLQEKELLLKEIHHRVKNNLFIVSSLLELQGDYFGTPEVIKMLSYSQNRIMSMALIHEQLYCDVNLAKIDLEQYLTALTNNLRNSYFSQKISCYCQIEKIFLNIETATPCGLIINELVTNAVEHAFPNSRSGNITLKASKNESEIITLIVQDDGIGLSDQKLFYESESLGMNLIFTLIEQIEGKLEVKSDHGTEVKITFKELNY